MGPQNRFRTTAAWHLSLCIMCTTCLRPCASCLGFGTDLQVRDTHVGPGLDEVDIAQDLPRVRPFRVRHRKLGVYEVRPPARCG